MPESRHRRRRGRVGPGGTRAGSSLAAVPRPRSRGRNWLYIAVSLVIALLVIGSFLITGLLGIFGGRQQIGSADQYVEGVGVAHEIMPTRNHVPDTQTVEYNSFPPTSGDHWARWSECGFFEEELPDERIGHNLEHSNIVVSYNLSTPEEVEQLRKVMNGIRLANTTGVTRAYSKIPVGTVALSAWGVSDTMEGIDQDRIEKFFNTYAGRLGPEGNLSCLNSGVLP